MSRTLFGLNDAEFKAAIEEHKLLTKEDWLKAAMIAEKVERYEVMTLYMRAIAREAKTLGVEERNLMSVAYKNAVGSRRASWRLLAKIVSSAGRPKDDESKEVSANEVHVALEMQKQVERELNDICGDILGLLDVYLIPNAVDDQCRVFYYKMKGDYLRYIAEFSPPEDREQTTARQAQEAYTKAQEVATTLLPTDPICLGLALNFSVFHYEILNDCDKACELAKKAFDEAIKQLDSLGDDSYRDSTLIMQLLRDNLTLWTAAQSDAQPQPEG